MKFSAHFFVIPIPRLRETNHLIFVRLSGVEALQVARQSKANQN